MVRTNRLILALLAASAVLAFSTDERYSEAAPPTQGNHRAGVSSSDAPLWSLSDLRWDPAISGKLKEIEELKQKIEQLRKLVVPKVLEKRSKPYQEKIDALQKEVDAYVRDINQAASAHEDSGQLLTPERFTKLEKLIRPSPGESRWAEIPWLLSVHDARKKAAAEGKPIFLWSAGGGPPLGGC